MSVTVRFSSHNPMLPSDIVKTYGENRHVFPVAFQIDNDPPQHVPSNFIPPDVPVIGTQYHVVANISPFTCRRDEGEAVPIPTFPLVSWFIRTFP